MSDPAYVHHVFAVDETAGTPEHVEEALRTWAAGRSDGTLEEREGPGGYFTWTTGDVSFTISVSLVGDDDRWHHARPIADSRLASAVHDARFLVEVVGNGPEDDHAPDVHDVWERAHDLRALLTRPGTVSVELDGDGVMGLAEATPGTALPEVDDAFLQDLRREQSSRDL